MKIHGYRKESDFVIVAKDKLAEQSKKEENRLNYIGQKNNFRIGV